MRVGDSLKRIREIGQEKETIYTCYVIDSERRLEGIVSLRDLVLADPDVSIESIMETQIIYVSTYDDQEYIADVFKNMAFGLTGSGSRTPSSWNHNCR